MKPRYDPRVFLALTISPGNKQRLGGVQALFKPVLDSWHFIPVENFHVTLRFLGETPEEDIPGIIEHCKQAAAELHPFTLEWDKVDFFGSPSHARVLFVAANPQVHLTGLVQQMQSLIPSASRDRREFTPHITLAKARTQLDSATARASANVLARLREHSKIGATAVELNLTTVHLDFVLMETVWVGRKVEYVIREKFALPAEES
jgi:2'-5' RNA ligase